MRQSGPVRPAVFFVIALALLILFVRAAGQRGGGSGGGSELETIHDGLATVVTVVRVIDGDTVVLRGGEKVRYVGIDAPERGEPFYRAARERNRALLDGAEVTGAEVTMEVCVSERRDKYGRTLAWVYSGGEDVGGVLIREGLATTLSIPPCGLRKKSAFKKYEEEAMREGLGIWGRSGN